MKFLVLFAVFFGLTSGATIKEQLLEKLTRSEVRLQGALAYSQAHQLTFHHGVYETWLKQVFESRRSVESLSDNVQPGQIAEKVEIMIQQEKLIATLVVDPSPTETAKTSAIYLAAMKLLSSYEADHQTAQKLIDEVLAIVKQEDWVRANGIRTHPNSINLAKANLDRMYEQLKSSTAGWIIPGFEDYYKLANKTRVLIESYRDHGMVEETTKMEEHLRKYDEITLAMARSWPIKDQKDVDHYYTLAKVHREHEIAMETPKQPPHTPKDGFLDSLYAAQKQLQDGIAHFRSRFQNYYAEWLNLETEPLNQMIKNIKGMSHNASAAEIYRTRFSVQGSTSSVHFAILRPDPAQTIKASALYVAALKEANLDTVHSNITSAQIKAEVAAIMHKELTFITPGMTLRQRVNALVYNQELTTMRRALEAELRDHGYKNLRGMKDIDDDLELENKVRAKIEDLKEAGKTQEASKGEYDLGLFITRTFNLNSLMPIDTDAKLEQYYLGVRGHYDNAQILQVWLNQTH